MERKDPTGRILRTGETYDHKRKRYRFTYTDPYKKRHSVFSNTLKGLRVKEDEINKNHYLGIDLNNANITLNEVFEIYMATKQNLTTTTRYAYRQRYESVIKDTIGYMPIASIKYDTIQRLYVLLYSEGRSYNYMSNVHTVLSACFTRALKNDFIVKNPCVGALGDISSKFDIDKTYHHRSALTLEQTKLFMDNLKDDNELRWKPLFILLFGTGMRIGEAFGLRWEDIDFENNIISVNHQIKYSYDERCRNHKQIITPPKTVSGIRLIPLLDDVKEALIKEKAYQKKLKIKCKSIIDGYTNFIFINGEGYLRSSNSVRIRIKNTVKRYNKEETLLAKAENRSPILLPNFTPHTARHTFCSRLCEQGVNIKDIQSIMGHSSISITMDIYAEVSEKVKVEKMRSLSYKLF